MKSSPIYIFVWFLFIKVLNQVTARWHPEDARREVLEEAPIFHPTEEVPTTPLNVIVLVCIHPCVFMCMCIS